MSKVEVVRQIRELYPNARIGFAYCTGTHGDPRLRAKVGLHGRHVLTVSLAVEFNACRTGIATAGEPVFHLVEVTSAQRQAGGIVHLRYGPQQFKFSKA